MSTRPGRSPRQQRTRRRARVVALLLAVSLILPMIISTAALMGR